MASDDQAPRNTPGDTPYSRGYFRDGTLEALVVLPNLLSLLLLSPLLFQWFADAVPRMGRTSAAPAPASSSPSSSIPGPSP